MAPNPYLDVVRRTKSASLKVNPEAYSAGENAMKSTHEPFTTTLFGGVFGLIAASLGQTREFLPAGTAVPESRLGHGRATSATEETPGVFTRVGRWILRRQIQGVAPQLARSQDVFDRLDRWLWSQHLRETEAYLAKSQDVFDLERRIKHLDRGPTPRF